ncbi:MAG: hypothetical protein C0621_08255 [Desulfuromonas sp.]|nr:MAG: hypothetical protein C0621_08255 [Desulfuromonas sp.]
MLSIDWNVMSRQRILFTLLTIFVGLLLSSSAVMWLIQGLFPALTQREWHCFSVLFGSVAGTIAAYWGVHRYERLNRLLESEVEVRRQAEEKAEEAWHYAQGLIDSSIDFIISVDTQRRIVEFNKPAQKAFGYLPEEIIGKHVEHLYADPQECQTIQNMLQQDGSYRGEVLNRRKNGETFPSFLSASFLTDKEGRVTGYMGISRDISKRKKLELELLKAATIDRLTGVYNRHKFEELIAAEIERSRRYNNPLSLMMFDLDHFKKVNDTYGHQIGDEVLREVATLIQGHIRANDLFCRWGGEEFMLLAPETRIEAARDLA